jgi:RHS repeat-associated protein
MVQVLDYEPYGSARLNWSSGNSGKVASQKTYIGEYSDSETGLSYLNARYYDPDRGQFLSQDSVYLGMGTDDKRTQTLLLDPQLQNSYSYAKNNPILLKDSGGECPFCVIAVLAYAPEITAALAFAATGVGIHFLSQDIATLQSDSVSFGEKAVVSMFGVLDLFGVGALGKVDDVTNLVGHGAGTAGTGMYNLSKGGRTLGPGSYGKESIPARSGARDFTREEINTINEMGKRNGCHTCGTKDPGTMSGNFVKDHQPPTALNSNNQPQNLLPQCINCSRQQGGTVNAMKNFFRNFSK